jgi:DNA-binding response OmpR family regulator
MRHAMLVEDDALVRTLLAHRLMEHHWRVTMLRDGRDLERMLADEPADLLIVDLGLPQEDGFALLQRLRDHGIRIPAFIITAHDLPHLEEMARGVGAAGVIQKPFNEDELLARAEALLAA